MAKKLNLNKLETNSKKKKVVPVVIPEDLLFTHIYKWRQALKEGVSPPKAGEEKDVELRL